MKALVICDDEDAMQKICARLSSRGVETIAYRWFLKALDNVEEIAPDVIIINASEYPRHWKILAQYVKGVVKKPCGLILYAPVKLFAEEQKKADALGVTGTFNSCEDDALEKLDALVKSETPAARIADADDIAESAFGKINALIFTHPKSGAFVTGNVVSEDAGVVEFEPDVPAFANGLDAGMRAALSYRRGENYESGAATLVGAEQKILIKID